MPLLNVAATPAAPLRFERLYLPLATVVAAWEFLRVAGERGLEQLCFLVGREVADGGARAAQVSACVLPVTVATPSYVTLTSHAQTASILELLEARGEIPLVSLHTHGGGGAGAEHSSIDDHGVALVDVDGVFSGVVPHYAAGSPLDFVEETTLYERVAGSWVRLGAREKRERISVYRETIRVVPRVAAGAGS